MSHILQSGGAGLRGPRGLGVFVRKRNVIRAGVAAVIPLLLFSTITAYRIQDSLTQETLGIYHRQVQRDDVLWKIRRNLWLAANASRDFLLNPHPDRADKFAAQIEELKGTSQDLLHRLVQVSGGDGAPRDLLLNIDSFWRALERIPRATENLNPAQRYDFVQNEITTRRVTVSNLVREFTEVAQRTARASEDDLFRSRQSAASRLLWVLGLLLVVGLLVGGYSIVHSESLERIAADQYTEVEKARRELQNFAGRLIQIQEEERTRLSRELHDEIGQALATLQIDVARAATLASASRPEIRERLARAGDLARQTVQTVRDISTLLRPSLLDDLGLVPALEWQVESFIRRTGVPCELRTDGLRDSLPDPVRTCVYRVIQESLHNCEKYANASWVSVAVQQEAGCLTVTVWDNGVGFDAAVQDRGRPAERFGILGMRERAAALFGSLSVRSEPGKGVEIVLRLPMEETGSSPTVQAEVQV